MADAAIGRRAGHLDGFRRPAQGERPCGDHRLSQEAHPLSASPSLAVDGAIATLTLRGGRHNAVDRAAWAALPDLVAMAGRSAARVLIVRGEGDSFAAGADIAEFDTVFADRAAALAYLDLMTAATAAIEAAPLPVIAAIAGPCIGAGVAIALACDVRIAAPDARLAITPAKLGLMYSLADTRRLVAAVGPSAAKDLLFTGRLVGADEARAIGLVDLVGDLTMATDRALAIAQLSAWTHARTKTVIGRVLGGAVADDETTRGWFADAIAGADYAEGLAAFRARRTPDFTAR